ncbi:hypothetical protein Tco_0099489 [Tanacetum coccineum]
MVSSSCKSSVRLLVPAVYDSWVPAIPFKVSSPMAVESLYCGLVNLILSLLAMVQFYQYSLGILLASHSQHSNVLLKSISFSITLGLDC